MEEYEKILEELTKRHLLTDGDLYDAMRNRILQINKDEIQRLKRDYARLKKDKYASKEDWDRLKELVFLTFGNPPS